MALGYDRKIYIMAFDHRGSFTKLFGLSGPLTPEDTARVADAKMLIFEGLQRAVAEGAPREEAGVLVDEQFGADVARKAEADGYPLAMPVERSGQDEFDFEYGEDFGAHIEDFDPTFSKVLVRSNPDWPREVNERQFARLKRLSGGSTSGGGASSTSCSSRPPPSSSPPSGATPGATTPRYGPS
jgi:myo-inositol catabolism protein IolC